MLHPDNIRKLKDKIEVVRGISIIEYPVEKCVAMYDRFQKITRTDGKKFWYQRENETPEQFVMQPWERQWIDNENLMCRCSFEYWFYRYFFLKDIAGYIRRPDKTVAHQMALDILREIDRQHLPMMLMFLKARQLGISTLIEAIIIWIALFRRGSYCIISSAEEEKSVKMSDMVWRCLDYLPLWMRPTLTAEDKSKGPEFGQRESAISIQHGSMKKGIGRGDTPVAAHLSEAAWYPDPINTIESSLFKAMHENQRSFLCLESTARKKGDWWHRTWVYNREGEGKGLNKFVCIFLPWYVGRDIYPTVDYIRNHPVPPDWKPNSITQRQALNAALYVAATPLLRKYMGANWKMPLEQQWYYEREYTLAARSDETLRSFFAEMCSDEREAFQSKRWSVYSQEVLDRIATEQQEVRYVDYAITGSGIQAKFNMQKYQSPGARRIPVYVQDLQGNPLEWKLVPLRETPEVDEEIFYLRVWELPKPGYNYTIGIDVSGGVGQDATVLDVLRVGKDGEPDVQVAQLWSRYISSPEAPPYAHCLGVLYGQHMSPRPEALMCPETQVATGDPISHQLALVGYTNFHYMQRYDMKKHPGSRTRGRRGWATLAWSRQMMLETGKQAIDAGWLIVNSERTLDELANMESEELDSGKTKFEHANEENDDCVFALKIAYFCSHDEEALVQRRMGRKPRFRPGTGHPESEREQGIGALTRIFQLEDKNARYDSGQETEVPVAW